jgi:pyruvate dehydrogenase E2 component (dihydrolipoamide acetyltransferase)
MAIAITIPRLGWNMDEGVFAGWLKQDGDTVRAGEPLFRLESDKATQEIECLDEGILRIASGGPKEGDRVAVGVVIAHLVAAGEKAPDIRASRERERPEGASRIGEDPAARGGQRPEEAAASPSVRRLARELGVDLRQVSGSGPGGRLTAEDVRGRGEPAAPIAAASGKRPASSPRARRVAQELGVDWTRLRGTGRGGRIRERDVRAAAGARLQPPPARPAPVSSVRRTIAERMLHSLRATAPVTLTTTVNAGNLVNLREQFKAVGDAVPSYTDFLVKLAAAALGRHPMLNARWEGEQILVSEEVHVGIAVDTEAGLLVPVVRDANRLTLRQVAARARELIDRARHNRLAPDDLRGGTFTVTNLGAYGVEAFTPIIRYPECAILGMGRIDRRPVVAEDRVVVGRVLTLSLTFDHRIVDGAPAARFLQDLGRLVEHPGPALMG